MSIQSEIERVRGNIASAYAAVTELGGEVPSAEAQNSGNLAQAVQSIPLGSQLVSLEVDHPPEKVDYFSGEIFDPAGLILEARFSIGALLHLIQPFPEQLTFYPAGPLELGLEHITAKLTWDDVERTCLLPVTVKKKYEAGVDWYKTEMPSSQPWASVTYGNGKFVAVAGYITVPTNKAAYSTDGVTWVETELPTSANWRTVTYGNGEFVAVAYNGTAAYSTDGVTWIKTAMPSGGGRKWSSVTFGNGKFVAAAGGNNTSTIVAAYSTDGVTWVETAMPSAAYWYSVTYGDGKFVMVAGGSAAPSDDAAYSTDGITWVGTKMPKRSDWIDVTYGDGKFVAPIYRSKYAAYSTDGITWIETATPESVYWEMITYGNGKFVTVAYSGTAAYSTDGVTWIKTAMPSGKGWTDVTYGDGKFVAISGGSNGSVMAACSSADGPPA